MSAMRFEFPLGLFYFIPQPQNTLLNLLPSAHNRMQLREPAARPNDAYLRACRCKLDTSAFTRLKLKQQSVSVI